MAIDGTYAITVDVGKHHETATIELVSDTDRVWISGTAPVVGTIHAVGDLKSDGSISASGTIKVLLKRITYKVAARVKDDTLIAVCETNLGTAEVVGKRISDSVAL